MNRKSFIALLLGAFAIPRNLLAKTDPSEGWRCRFVDKIKAETRRLHDLGIHVYNSDGHLRSDIRIALTKQDMEDIRIASANELGYAIHKQIKERGVESLDKVFGFKPWFNAPEFGLILVPDSRILFKEYRYPVYFRRQL